jgi:hypothetical protein
LSNHYILDIAKSGRFIARDFTIHIESRAMHNLIFFFIIKLSFLSKNSDFANRPTSRGCDIFFAVLITPKKNYH